MFSPLRRLAIRQNRLYSSAVSLTPANIQALDEYIAAPKNLLLQDTFNVERVSDLLITLPTRDGSRRPYETPAIGDPVGHGWHLGFFHARTPESLLSPDGTDGALEFGPPEPFVRRMWASGRISWNAKRPLLVGKTATSSSTFGSVEKKGFDTDSPMVFVTQRINVTMMGEEQPSITEERSHVYMGDSVSPSPIPRVVKGIPTHADFTFKFTPSLITLFRFSALMFNAHLIHLDKDWTQSRRGYPERLVHGPLTALMLLEAAKFHHPTAQFASFEYRARNPVVVDTPMTFKGVWVDKQTVTVWCEDDTGVVGMTGKISLQKGLE
ncbi:histone H2B [Favolaschia claudopus]|uniref:Histone H2B n=1 Tax=Favolaschia claudopus TaxID=2862362 RepID=A0AAW0ARR5_9AGAR